MNKKGTLILPIAIPGAGKSSWAESYKVLNPDTIIVSSDSIRKEIYGDENDQTHNCEVFNLVNSRCREGLLEGKTVICDATNLNRKRRMSFIKSMPPCNVEAVVFAIPFEVCCERNSKRERVVPPYVMERLYKSFQPPFYNEGFDEIEIISYGDLKFRWDYYLEIFEKNSKTEHDNPYHTKSCGEHCSAAARYIMEHQEDIPPKLYIFILCGALYHDMSKFKCKVFQDSKGKETNIAHFYRHESVSAYDYLVCAPNKNNLFVANLISNHMVFYNGEKAVNKIKKDYGEDFFMALEWVHKADKSAH